MTIKTLEQLTERIEKGTTYGGLPIWIMSNSLVFIGDMVNLDTFIKNLPRILPITNLDENGQSLGRSPRDSASIVDLFISEETPQESSCIFLINPEIVWSNGERTKIGPAQILLQSITAWGFGTHAI